MQLSGRSQKTTSSVDVITPASQNSSDHAPSPIFRLKSVRRGEEQSDILFRATLASTQDLNWEHYEPGSGAAEEDVPKVPAIPDQFKAEPDELNGTTVDMDDESRYKSDVSNWSTKQVAAWMYNSGFENLVISAFKTHDISGPILLDLDFEDLREFDIYSFGKRRQIWNEINALRNEGSPDPLKPSVVTRDRSCSLLPYPNEPEKRTRRPGFGFDRNGTVTGYRRPGRSSSQQMREKQHPIMEVPRPHRCSKGEKCPKWKQQQRIIADIDREHGTNTPPAGKFDLPSPRTSPRIGHGPPPPTQKISIPETTRTSMSSGSITPTGLTRILDESIPPVPPIPSYNYPAPSYNKSYTPPLDTQHIVQQHPSSNPASALSPDTPRLEAFPDPAGSEYALGHPPRNSSLVTIPKLAVPPPSTHSPSSSDSTLRNGDQSSTVSLEHPALSQSNQRAPSPNNAIVTKQNPQASIHPLYRQNSASSDLDLVADKPAPLFNRFPPEQHFAVAPSKPAPLRSASSSDAIHRRRNVHPLPTLKEGTLQANRDTDDIEEPVKTAPATRSSPSVGNVGASMKVARTGSPHDTRRISVQSGRESLNFPRPAHSKPGSRSGASSPTPSTASSALSINAPLPPTPALSAPGSTLRASYASPTAALRLYGPGILCIGWARQRRVKIWRHEWVPVHLRLTGLSITVHRSARPDEKPLEIIRMDEFEVACTSESGGNNKFAAAFRGFKSVGGKNLPGASPGAINDNSFVFQLQPATDPSEARPGTGGGSITSGNSGRSGETTGKSDNNSMLNAFMGGKSEKKVKSKKELQPQHFAVKTRDERIEWMRQLMMARALRGKERGESARRARVQQTAMALKPLAKEHSF